MGGASGHGRFRGSLIATASANTDTRDGIAAGLIAYTLWGFLPIYFKLVSQVAPSEILFHRIIWAVPFGALIIHARRQWAEVRRALTHRRMLAGLCVTALLIAINWFIYIVAIQTDHIFQASLGYYINPLIFVLAGVVFFAERLNLLQKLAVALAAAGVGVLASSGSEFPWIALGLGFSFAAYGVIRKRVVIGAMPGLFVETLVLAPLALVMLGWMMQTGQSSLRGAGPGLIGLILLSGPVTVVPLVMFAVAARKLALTTVAFMQFLAPSLQFLAGIYYGEQLTIPRIVCFACIWAAVIAFSTDAILSQKKRASA